MDRESFCNTRLLVDGEEDPKLATNKSMFVGLCHA